MLILDGDPFAWKAAVAHEKLSDWGDGICTAHINKQRAVESATKQIDSIAEKLKAEVVFCWSDPSGYFRHELGDYKGGRKESIRPLGLEKVKRMLAEHYESFMRPKLEGDDIIGILMTEPRYKQGYEKIAVSIDKDIQTVPGLFFNPDKDASPRLITEQDADNFFYAQCIAGDPTDGFQGAPSFGMATALRLIMSKKKVELYEHVLKSGKRKGETELRRREVPCDDPWEIVLSTYEVNDLSEEVALLNARMARILRASDWDNENKKVILWKPKQQKAA
ncbi:hypothetical protein [Pleionea sp. CnH1-48]|uniref:hypothetical protein n=1 Tax=Pleionea sp. CnH1-48 TaxID=2954494 RepID=UPI002097971A|nr:hypothetical protein [Pleionea sp. CnH1-48]MCO7225287.1 hypothetical protein [Pleionea sp. CnH1-48]